MASARLSSPVATALPGVALTAAITGKLPKPAGIVVAVASGGNVDPALFAAILGRTPPL